MRLVVCGPPGVGKTTVAERLRDRLEAGGSNVETLRSDDFSRNTYERLYERAVDADPTCWPSAAASDRSPTSPDRARTRGSSSGVLGPCW